MDDLSRTLRREKVAVPLNRRAFDLLLYLVQNPGKVVSRESTCAANHVWQWQGSDAAAEFQKVLDHPGLVINEPDLGHPVERSIHG